MSNLPELCDHPTRGPQHWDWRCLRCDQPIRDHDPFLVRQWRIAKRWLRSFYFDEKER
jgi:hypothetical protein